MCVTSVLLHSKVCTTLLLLLLEHQTTWPWMATASCAGGVGTMGDPLTDSKIPNESSGGQPYQQNRGAETAQTGACLSAPLGVSGERAIALTSIGRGPQGQRRRRILLPFHPSTGNDRGGQSIVKASVGRTHGPGCSPLKKLSAVKEAA